MISSPNGESFRGRGFKRRRVDGQALKNSPAHPNQEQLRHSCLRALERLKPAQIAKATETFLLRTEDPKSLSFLGELLGADLADWTCPRCSNVNFHWRTHCNMRKCQAPRQSFIHPQHPPHPQDWHHQNGMNPHHGMTPHPPNMDPYHHHAPAFSRQPFPQPPPHTHSAHPEPPMPMAKKKGPESRYNLPGKPWDCPECGNSNYGFRKVCNMRKCGESRPPLDWRCEKCKKPNFHYRTNCRECSNVHLKTMEEDSNSTSAPEETTAVANVNLNKKEATTEETAEEEGSQTIAIAVTTNANEIHELETTPEEKTDLKDEPETSTPLGDSAIINLTDGMKNNTLTSQEEEN